MSATKRFTAVSAVAAAVLSTLATAPVAVASADSVLQTPLAGHHLVGHGGLILHSTSGNWAGYAATGSTFNSVSASWVQPAVTCGSATTYSSFWVGIDGDGSNSVEQTGTEADCSGGRAYYSSWYEMYPAYPVNYSNTVSPGDHFTATVSASGNSFTMTLSDTTRGWTKTTTKSSSTASKASAEVIAEAPSSSSGVLPLSKFGTASFTGSTANGQAIGNYGPDKINMATGSTTKATTSALSGGGNFSVTWNHS
jgi:hypothetical protein